MKIVLAIMLFCCFTAAIQMTAIAMFGKTILADIIAALASVEIAITIIRQMFIVPNKA